MLPSCPGLVVFGAIMAISIGARATPPPMLAPSEQGTSAATQPENSTNPVPTNVPGFLAALSRSNYLLGDMGGLRPALAKFGVSLNLSETSEGLGNITGGSREGFEYDGLTQMDLQLDTQTRFWLLRRNVQHQRTPASRAKP